MNPRDLLLDRLARVRDVHGAACAQIPRAIDARRYGLADAWHYAADCARREARETINGLRALRGQN